MNIVIHDKNYISKTELSMIYNAVYGHIAKKEKYEITNNTKAIRIGRILETLEFEERTVLRARCKYHTIEHAAKVSHIDKKRFDKVYKMAIRHMYAPSNIATAIPKFYKIRRKHQIKLVKSDFGDEIYILNALNKSGIYTREQLMKHLSLGWYYLWSIPRCGDNARQAILIAISRWNNASK